MSYFLTDQNLSVNQLLELGGEESRHILLARRMKKGERFNLQGADEKRYEAEIVEIGRKMLKLRIIAQVMVPQEPGLKITLFQSLVNEKALDFILQKSTELQANKIVLFNSKNTAVKLSSDVFKKKQDRWQKILWEAAKQSDRVHPPELEYLSDLNAVVLLAGNYNRTFLCDVEGQPVKNLVNFGQSIKFCSIIIGPEGGFTPEEIVKIKTLPNCTALSLGPILLRAETAALASVSLIMNQFN